MWALGCILYIMLSAAMPFDDTNITKMLKCQLNRTVCFASLIYTSNKSGQQLKSLLWCAYIFSKINKFYNIPILVFCWNRMLKNERILKKYQIAYGYKITYKINAKGSYFPCPTQVYLNFKLDMCDIIIEINYLM